MNDLSKIKRGEVFYITQRLDTVGSEMRSGRPAVIVSNNMCNEHSPCVEVCFLTLQEKKNLPTHILIDRGACINSTIICEQVTTVSKERLGDYMCKLPDDIMDAVDKALIISLGLDYIIEKNTPAPIFSTPTRRELPSATAMDKLRAEKDELEIRNKELSEAVRALTDKADKAVEYYKEAEMYKTMYDKLLDRVIGK